MTDAIISYVQLDVFDYFYFLILYSCSELRDIGMAYFLVYKQISLAYNLAGHRFAAVQPKGQQQNAVQWAMRCLRVFGYVVRIRF